MVKCSAYKCNSASYNKTPGLSFHRFPKDNDLKKIWVQNMNRENWQPTSSSVLCSKHFEAHLKDSSAFCTILRPGAIPTLFEEYSENEENLPPTVSSRKRCVAGNFVSLVPYEKNYNVPEPQPCSSAHKDFSHFYSDASKKTEERCAVGYIASVLQDVKNILEPEPPSSSHSTITLQIDKTKKFEDHRPGSSKEEKLKRKISLKNKKIKNLQQKTRRLKNKVCKLSDIIKSLKKKIL